MTTTTKKNTSMSTLVQVAQVYEADVRFTFDRATGSHGAVLSRVDGGSLLLRDALERRGYEITSHVRAGGPNLPSTITVAL